MSRTLFHATIGAAALVALTALALRYELAAPGVSVFFTRADGTPNGAAFTDLAMTHRMLSLLAVLLLGTAMAAAARDRGAVGARPVILFGATLSVALFLAIMLSIIPWSAPPATGVGWTLYPPLSTTSPVLDRLMLAVGLDPLMLFFGIGYLFIPVVAVLYSGVFMMMATLAGPRWIGGAGTLLALAALAGSLASRPYGAGTAPIHALQILVALVILAACAAATRQRPAWLITLVYGAVVSLGAHVWIFPRIDAVGYQGTVAQFAIAYVLPFGLAWFALPALIMMRGSRDPSGTALGAMLFALTATLAAWIAPSFILGLMGQPHGYIDYPDAFAAMNLAVSWAVLGFVLVYAALLWWLHKTTG